MLKIKRCPVCGRKRRIQREWSDESKVVQPAVGPRKAVTLRFFECSRCRFEIAMVVAGKQRKRGKKIWTAVFKAMEKLEKESRE